MPGYLESQEHRCRTGGPDPPEMSQVTGTDPIEKQLYHLGSIASQGRLITPSVKYIDGYVFRTRLTEISGFAHEEALIYA